ncbi:PssE/Cps14G family polysaccharide biosynthesis glycosyltransferase [Amedibacterium intestinale]|uniref:PssE/Cps14G family polysaccharide biosynthesis glycosyltransferase n=1 Tax=Amedibacterium intestinale TaxID=2583452 RepID=UPI000E4B064B|nr:PssE/Cps14G family polysaccharide biosynthesis glycosyltransferase [Amedibacterium intestinale]RHO21535.1 beta(1,3)galactosyltransferase EpsH [Eubacterium sp. AM18-26]RHO25699.1 beta(1,3)galactosyltransferase EpsH [Eubacterium sp. AM18-10LB-B]RHO28954.1 beta(1,3)galactosyltransferase EpsH [Erysipelotrichaceae bacterium AM17-60]
MIFITLGSQKFQFNRLIKKIDELVANEIFNDVIFAQIGYSDYIPKNYKYSNFLDQEKFKEYMKKSDIVITHSGTGAIMSAIKAGKKTIVVPRLKKFEEHVDDHQIQIAKEFENLNLVVACYDIEDLESKYTEIKNKKLDSYISNTETIINCLDSFIKTIK